MQLIDAFTDILYFTVVNKDIDFGQFDLQHLQKRYQEMISDAERAVRQSGIPDSRWRNALFGVAVWIDEVVLLSEWPHRTVWQKQSLQRTYFHTANGGSEFYKRLESLDTSETEVLEMYDVIMSLGFKGELFRDTDAAKKLHITERTMRLLASTCDLSIPEKIFGSAYGSHFDLERGSGNGKTLLIRGALVAVPPLVFGLVYLFLFSRLSALAGIWIRLF